MKYQIITKKQNNDINFNKSYDNKERGTEKGKKRRRREIIKRKTNIREKKTIKKKFYRNNNKLRGNSRKILMIL
jgi:hypothetical protein